MKNGIFYYFKVEGVIEHHPCCLIECNLYVCSERQQERLKLLEDILTSMNLLVFYEEVDFPHEDLDLYFVDGLERYLLDDSDT